jgi:hypothetical protein
VIWYRFEVPAMNVVMNLQVSWRWRNSSVVLRLFASQTRYGSHALPKSVSPARIYSMTPRSGVGWIKLYLTKVHLAQSFTCQSYWNTLTRFSEYEEESIYTRTMTLTYPNPAFYITYHISAFIFLQPLCEQNRFTEDKSLNAETTTSSMDIRHK